MFVPNEGEGKGGGRVEQSSTVKFQAGTELALNEGNVPPTSLKTMLPLKDLPVGQELAWCRDFPQRLETADGRVFAELERSPDLLRFRCSEGELEARKATDYVWHIWQGDRWRATATHVGGFVAVTPEGPIHLAQDARSVLAGAVEFFQPWKDSWIARKAKVMMVVKDPVKAASENGLLLLLPVISVDAYYSADY